MMFCNHGKLTGTFCTKCPDGLAEPDWTNESKTAESAGLPMGPAQDIVENDWVLVAPALLMGWVFGFIMGIGIEWIF